MAQGLGISVATEGAKKYLADGSFSHHGNKVLRFCRLFGETLKPTVTPDGFLWAAERVLLDEANDYELPDRVRIRNLLPEILLAAFRGADAGMEEFRNETRDLLLQIKKGTLNLD